MRGIVYLGVVVCLLLPTAVFAQQSPEKTLEDAENQFRQQQYRQTVEILRPVVHPILKLKNPDDINRARELLGGAYWFLNDFPNAEREWTFLLIARPAFELDDFYYPKAMREQLDKIRQTLIQQNVIKKISEITSSRNDNPPTVLRIRVVEEHRSRATAFMPFGVGQFENGDDRWGWFFVTTQTTAALTSLSTAVAYVAMSANNPYGFNKSSHKTASTLFMTSIVSGAVFWGLATWGIIDANVRHVPTKIVKTERTIIQERTADIRAPQPQRVGVPTAGGSR